MYDYGEQLQLLSMKWTVNNDIIHKEDLFVYQADEKRYETMKYHRCGASGLMLPELSLGLWHNFGDTVVYETQMLLYLQSKLVL